MKNQDIYVVIVDTRGMSTSQIYGYEEHTCTESEFNQLVLGKPNVKCTKSKVAALCGMDMEVYFHEFFRQEHIHNLINDAPKLGIMKSKNEFLPLNKVNRGATLLTFDPQTGLCDYVIEGKAYVVVSSGNYPLSSHQVWGIQDLISEARDIYYCDPEHSHRGSKELQRWCREYRRGTYGPLTIYQPRAVLFKESLDDLSTRTVVPEDHYRRHRHGDDLSTRTVVPEDHYRRHRHGTQRNPSNEKKLNRKFACGNELVLGDVSNSRHHSNGSNEEFPPKHVNFLSCLQH